VAVREELADGRLVQIKWAGDPLATSVVMIWHAEKWCSPLLKHFMALAEEVMAA
jgi:hypothetical protein